MQETFKPLPPSCWTEEVWRTFLTDNGYYEIRQLPDGTWCALNRLMFTVGLCVGLTETSWERRFCYANECDARGALNDLTAWDDLPEPIYVARRGTF